MSLNNFSYKNSWYLHVGLSLEDSLELLILLCEYNIGVKEDLEKEIDNLQNLIASQEIEKMLGGIDGI